MEPRKQKEKSGQHIPEGRFEGQSIYNSDYTGMIFSLGVILFILMDLLQNTVVINFANILFYLEKDIVRVSPFVPETSGKKLEKFKGEATYTGSLNRFLLNYFIFSRNPT